jgi:predicted lipoprotein with Yx(FWY)xxD motif
MIRSLTRLERRNRLRMLLALPAVAAAAAVLAACSSSATSSASGGGTSGSSPAAATAGGLKTATIGGATVPTSAKGFTLYSFAPDTPASSKCYGSCAAYWPPVTGPAAASPGVPGRIGTIRRTDGTEQLTYNGHPLYAYIGDTAAGQARGNNLNLNGGLWHDVPVSR